MLGLGSSCLLPQSSSSRLSHPQVPTQLHCLLTTCKDEDEDGKVEVEGEDFPHDRMSLLSLIKSCRKGKNLQKARRIHAHMILDHRDSISRDAHIATTLITTYAKCGALEEATHLFNHLPLRDVVSWNALITAYAQHGLGYEALECFRNMPSLGVRPSAVTFACILKACGIVGTLEIGEDVDAEVRRQGLLQKDVVLGNALVDMYSKCGVMEKARGVFEELPVKNVVTWSSLIAGYVQLGLADEALKCFRQMQDSGVIPDEVTYVYVLKTCGMLGSQEIGEGIDFTVRKQGLLQRNVVLCTALVDMYSKCGAHEKAREMFEKLPMQDIISWSALISGYAQSGQANTVLDLYRRMRGQGIVPNVITFTGLLTACSHSGLLKEGEILFDEMCVVYGLVPSVEHYTCMVDLFGRAGHFDNAKALLDKMPHLPLFSSILGACRKWKNVVLGKWVFEQSIRLDKMCAATYVCMENIIESEE